MARPSLHRGSDRAFCTTAQNRKTVEVNVVESRARPGSRRAPRLQSGASRAFCTAKLKPRTAEVNVFVNASEIEQVLANPILQAPPADVHGQARDLLQGRMHRQCRGFGCVHGSCDATCSGSCTAEGGVQCAGQCEGTCEGNTQDGAANGTCQGMCKGTCSATAPNAHCTGFCAGSGSGACQGSASASVKCDGTCDGEIEPLRCTGGELSGGCTPPRASCNGSCDASVKAKAECTPPSIQVSFTGALDANAVGKLKATLEANLGVILAFKSRLALMSGVVSSFSANISAVTDIKPVCIPSIAAQIGTSGRSLANAVTVTGSLATSVNAS